MINNDNMKKHLNELITDEELMLYREQIRKEILLSKNNRFS